MFPVGRRNCPAGALSVSRTPLTSGLAAGAPQLVRPPAIAGTSSPPVHASHPQVLRCAFKMKFILEYWLFRSPGDMFTADSVSQPSFKVKRCQGAASPHAHAEQGHGFAHIRCSGWSEGFEIEILQFILKHNY